MKIIKRLSDNTVVFAGEQLSLTPFDCKGDSWAYKGLNSTNAVLEIVDGLPDNFIPGGFTYLGGLWTPNQIGLEHIAKQTAVDNEALRLMTTKDLVLSDPLVIALRAMTPEGVDTWCDTNITSLTDVKLLMKKIIKILITMNEGK